MEKNNKIDIFENKPVPQALATMAIPAIISQLIALFYNVADTWFIGQTDNPYMVAASSLVLPVFLITTVLSAMFGTGGGSLADHHEHPVDGHNALENHIKISKER